MTSKPHSDLETYYSVRWVADYLNVDPKTVRRWIKDGSLTAGKPGGGAWRISETNLRRFLRDS